MMKALATAAVLLTVSTPTFATEPAERGATEPIRHAIELSDVQMDGIAAGISYWDAGLVLLDVSDPTEPYRSIGSGNDILLGEEGRDLRAY